MTTVPDIPVVHLPALDADGVAVDGSPAATGTIWAVDVPHARRLTPMTIAVLGVLTGIAAMVLGAAAVISAGSSAPSSPAAAEVAPPEAPPAVPTAPRVERRALALLAKPSTERVAFRGASGLVLAVGSAGRAAILIRGLPPTSRGVRYNAWIVAPRSAPLRAARFAGTERAVFLAKRLGLGESVVVSTNRPVAGPPEGNRVVALRG